MTAAASEELAPALRPLRVVLADDTPDVRLLQRVALTRFGDFVVVAEAADGREAVAAVREHTPDAIILDLAMPVMDGLQAIPEIVKASPNTKILVLSGFTRSGMQSEAMKLGAHAYLEKGGSMENVAATLRSLCDRPAWPATQAPERPKPGADAMPQELLSVLAHELSSPVAVIHGFAETLKRHSARVSEEERQQYIDAILRATRQISSLVGAFGDVRGIDTDAIDLSLEPTDVGAFAREVVEDLRQVLADHPIEAEAEEGLDTSIDRVRFRQVLTNLLSNAAKFSPVGAPISMRAYRDDSWIVVSVRDHGPGIPPEAAEILFRKFSRLERDRGVGGMGLGLYISRGIARAHGGDLSYEPAPGGGSTFRFRLPI